MLAGPLPLLINFCCPILSLLAQSQQEAVPGASAASGFLLGVWGLTGFGLLFVHRKLLVERHLQIIIFSIICAISLAACRLSLTEAIRLVPSVTTVGEFLLICHERTRQQERQDSLPQHSLGSTPPVSPTARPGSDLATPTL